MFKLIALDLDGTLLNSSMRLSEVNEAALRDAMSAGLQIVFATARFYGIAKRTADRVGIETPLICSNGALVKRPTDGHELLHLTLDQELAREVTMLGDERGWEMFTTIGDTTYMQMRPGIIPEKLPGGLKVAERHSDHIDEGAPTCVLVYSADAADEIAARFLPKYESRAGFSFNRPSGLPHYVIITHPDADKASALEIILRELNVDPKEVVAVGDSESDLAMLRMAGLGIAMRNSPDEVKAAALHIAPTNDEDGVAWALRKFVL